MRKHIEHSSATTHAPAADIWIDLDRNARVEVTSEAEDSPIENALVPGSPGGWRAGEPGPQTLRLHFDQSQKITRIHLQFDVTEQPRTQEFSIRWSGDGGATYQQVIRQQFNFSPPFTTREEEDYRVDLVAVTDLELIIVPDVSGGGAYASLTELRIS